MELHPFNNGVVVENSNGTVIALLSKPRPEKGKIPRGTWWIEYTEYATRSEMLEIQEVVREQKFPFFKGCRKLIDKTNPQGYKLFFY